jgi:cell division transport system permease protein
MADFPTGGPVRRALGLIGRRPFAWLAAVLVAGLALAALLLVAIALWSLRPVAEHALIAPEATVTVAAGAAAAEVDALRASLDQLPAVAATRFVSRDAALAQLASRTPADREAIGTLAANPLPDVVIVSFRPDAAPDAIESIAAVIRKMAHVDAVEVDLGWYRKLRAIAGIGVVVSVAALSALAIHAGGWLIVAVAVSAPIDPQRVRLLWMLGADDRGVRRAPVAAGAVTALAAVGVALVAARVGWMWLRGELGALARMYASQAQLQWPPPSWLAAFAVAVVLAGAVLGSVRARARLRAIRRAPAGSTLL